LVCRVNVSSPRLSRAARPVPYNDALRVFPTPDNQLSGSCCAVQHGGRRHCGWRAAPSIEAPWSAGSRLTSTLRERPGNGARRVHSPVKRSH